MQEQIYLNGSFVTKEEAKISVMDRGFLFGDGVYELIPVYNGKPFLLDKHLSRLDNSLDMIEIKKFSNEFRIKEIIAEIISKNKYRNHFIYIQITRGIHADRQHIYQSKIDPSVLVMGQFSKPYTFEEIKNGFKAIIHEDYRWRRANIKSTSLLGNVLLKNHAAKQGMYETILIHNDKVTEGSASNIFFVKDNKVYTPRLGNELLSGVTRNLILELLQSNKYHVEESEVTKGEIKSADEIWCSSSTNPIAPIIEVDGVSVNNGIIGNVTLATHKLVSDFISKY